MRKSRHGLHPEMDSLLPRPTQRDVHQDLEADRRQAQKMEALGRLASGIAHDFNNLLTVINGYSQMLLQRVGPRHELHDELEQIVHAGERAAAFTRQLLLFSSPQRRPEEPIDLNELVADNARMLGALVGDDIELRTVLAANLPPVAATPVQIMQMLLNLAANARDAMPQGGRLTLETARGGFPSAPVRLRAAGSGCDDAPPPTGAAGARLERSAALPAVGGLTAPPSWVLLRVHDTGCGMDRYVQEHMFEPFFTTKSTGRGTGLGLATVADLVCQLHGYIEVASAPNQGSTFTIYLPQAAKEAAALAGPLPTAQRAASQATLLLVEDTESVRSLMARVLAQQGYQVLTAASGAEALALVEQRQQPVDLLVSDVLMPRMSGQQLAEQLLVRWPGMPILFLSGCPVSEHQTLPPGCRYGFLQKPFTPQLLLQEIHQILSRQPP
jgi:two-component system cell cycle sensor histidine kinase/response regulator CckA